MAPKAVTRQRTERPRRNPDPFLTKVVQFLTRKDEFKRAQLEVEGDRKKKIRGLRDDVLDYVLEKGDPDHTGSRFLTLTKPVTIGDDTYTELKAEARHVTVIDEEYAEELIDKKKLRERCFKTIEVLDQDEIYAAHQDGKITDEELDLIFQETVSYSLKPLKG
jgi:hypothetical protein